jgi:hypothetical protein
LDHFLLIYDYINYFSIHSYYLIKPKLDYKDRIENVAPELLIFEKALI